MKQESRALRIVSVILLLVMVLALCGGCNNSTPEEKFQKEREQVQSFENETSKEMAEIFKEKFVSLLEEEGVKINDYILVAAPAGTGHYMALKVLTDSDVISYEVAGNGWGATREEYSKLERAVNLLFSGEEQYVEEVRNYKFKFEDNQFEFVS